MFDLDKILTLIILSKIIHFQNKPGLSSFNSNLMWKSKKNTNNTLNVD